MTDTRRNVAENSATREEVYRSGIAAKFLGISSYQLRRLCEAGLVRAEITASGQWLLPASEIARLQEEGIPPLPQQPAEEAGDPVSSLPRADGGRWREPAKEVAQRVADSADDVAVTANLLRKREIEWKAVAVEDRFLERTHQAAQQKAAIEETRLRQKTEEEVRRDLREWRNSWHRYATNSMPDDVPPEVKLSLPDYVDEALAKTNPSRPESVTRSLVDAAIDLVLEPWRHQNRIEAIVKTAVAELPWDARGIWKPTEWDTRAAQSVRQALRQLPDWAQPPEMEAAACQAVAAIALEFEHSKICRRLVSQIYLSGGTSAEEQRAKDTAAHELGAVAAGASESLMKQRIEQALAPLRAEIRRREELELRERVIRWAPLPSGISEGQRHLVIALLQRAFSQLPEGLPQGALEELRDRTLAPLWEAHANQNRKA
ncbi:MAG: hypothetical protein Q8N47_19070 [Bryobacterales bacterium]|nr:hypothetical protein [Bryobacterales bacterium]